MVSTKIPASDIMHKDVATLKPDDTADKALAAMVKRDIGSVVVIDKGAPIGIVTDSDLLERVFAEKKDPKTVKVRGIMSHPIRTIAPGTDLEEVLRIMRDLGTKRLPVMLKGKLVGLVTENDIVRIAPALFDIIKELTELRVGYTAKTAGKYAGMCENCNEYSEDIRLSDGELLCEECR
jgi:CBS domain-containing protein